MVRPKPLPTGDRSDYIGSSNAAAILGLSPWCSKMQVYLEKNGLAEEIDDKKRAVFARGHRFEPVVIGMLCDELTAQGHEVRVMARNRRYVHNEHPFIGSEIDVELLVDGEEVNGEAKTVSPFAAKLWGAPDSGDVPLYYQAQCMHAMSVYPRRRTVIGAMVGLDDFRVRWIERDDDLIQIITAKEVEFWQDVQAGRMPAPTTASDVAWLYQDRGEAVEITADAALAVEKLRQIKQQQAALDAEREQLELKIQLQMRDAATALDSTGQTLATWRQNKERKATDWKAVAQALGASPALIEQHTRTEPGARVFRLTKG